ncbi:MAG TPA: CBS domain-containing protein [Acidobacteriota bacterium]|nr:CBS domain-containing protein [Acidobacteriota bacterium]HNB69713.1 CBS domain-containing protein [Acidobacteriota bacterium]HNC43068.1 CBS domain-containing protein [Acidobacteriota bacterium]HND22227.1 CBS domain-containing protein [Acidobacteriota bacterium]HNH81854.1 CBS domain-containing protein [Acidobacteriota bacterium]
MRTVKELLGSKPMNIWSITPEASVFQALELMAEKEIGALVVLSGSKLVGLLSERDYARKVILKGKASKETRVREIMTDKLITIRPETSIDECMALMTDKRIRHLPVLEGERLVGMISIGDVVKAIISEQKFIIQQLENYITA